MAPARCSTEARPLSISCDELQSPQLELLGAPIDYLYAEHFRQRCVCKALRVLAARAAIPGELADGIVAFLRHDLPLHHRDEEEDLFPRLRTRSQSEDALEPLFAELSADHIDAETNARKLVEALASGANDGTVKLDRRSAEVARSYANSEQRHLAIENGIVMLIARKRLKLEDLQAMSQAMKARRETQI